MNNNEKRWIILLIAVVIIAIVLIIVLPRVSNNEGEVQRGESEQAKENEEKYTTVLDDGTKVNTGEEFNSTKMYGNLEISNIHFSEQNGSTVLIADVINKGSTRHEEEVVKISIIGENGEVLSTTKPIIGKMDPGETVQINATITADVSNAKNFTIEAVE